MVIGNRPANALREYRGVLGDNTGIRSSFRGVLSVFSRTGRAQSTLHVMSD